MPDTVIDVGVKKLGKDLTRFFAARGMRVLCAARTEADVRALASEVNGVPVVCDITVPSSLASLREETIDLCIAAQSPGGRFGSKPLLEIDDDELARGLEVSVRGTWNLLKAVGAGMVTRKRGTFLQIGTSSGARTKEGFAALGTSQHALRAMIQVAAREWRAHQVHAAYVTIDGPIESEKTRSYGLEQSKLIDPRAIAAACAYLYEQPPRAWTHELVLRPTAGEWSLPT